MKTHLPLLLLLGLTLTACLTPETPAPVEDMTASAPDATVADLAQDLPPSPSEDMPADVAPDEPADMPVEEDAARDLTVDTPADMPPAIIPGPPGDRPMKVLFIGNSFTFGGPVPVLFEQLATDAGWPTPDVTYSAFGGERLSGHRDRPETVSKVDEGGWDFVVLQEFSTGPTDGLGNPERFKQDATWFYDRVKASSPEARVFLYMTWAREEGHQYYPNSFADPAEMQAQLRTHYNDAADRYIPEMATTQPPDDVEVARAGDAWEQYLMRPGAVRLHASDRWHAGAPGQYLNALVIYGSIYRRATLGRTTLKGVQVARDLQEVADAVTGQTTPGGPSGQPTPGLEVGRRMFVDFGPEDSETPTWNNLTDPVRGALGGVLDDEGTRTRVSITVSDGFTGVNPNGVSNNGLGWPGTATGDTFWVGSFDGHEAALRTRGHVTISGLEPGGTYSVSAYGARTGSDGGRGRLTRYTLGGASLDVESADNADRRATFPDAVADAQGGLTLEVAPSPAGSGRFGYLNALEVERVR